MRRNLGKAISLALALAACGPTPRGNGPDAGGGGPDSGNGGVDGNPNPNSDGCPDEAKLVYVIDESSKQLSQFDPKTKMFNDLGTLPCQPSTAAKPFSMAVARDATAWVLYDNGELFRVETRNNLNCVKSTWTPSTSGLKFFGMGFSTDQVGGTTDTLFISGGPNITDSTTKLARLDLTSLQPAQVGYVTGWPELTGTGNAELWGFFPSETDSRIVQIGKTSAAALRTYSEPALNNPDPNNSSTTAWAFAFHGGSFWVFLRKYGETATIVYQVNSSTGAIVSTMVASGRSIVGAGVSTCAPIIL